METRPIDVFSEEVNYAILRAPGRNFPGCLIQGDSLAILCRNALRVVERVRALEITDEDLLGEVQSLTNALIGRLLHYQDVLREHQIRLPHSPLSQCDLVQLTPPRTDD